MSKFSDNLQRKVPGVKAIIGQSPDYAELAFQHLDATGDYLFGKQYDFNYAITKTPTTGSKVAYVGWFSSKYGLTVSEWSRDGYRGSVYAVPLVVPLTTKTQEIGQRQQPKTPPQE